MGVRLLGPVAQMWDFLLLKNLEFIKSNQLKNRNYDCKKYLEIFLKPKTTMIK